MITQNEKIPAPKLASEAGNQRPEMEGNLMEVDPTAAAIVDASVAMFNETSSKVSRADALTEDKRQALGEALTQYFVALDSDIGIDTPDRILCVFDYHDSRNIDDLIDRAIVPALTASPVAQPAAAPINLPACPECGESQTTSKCICDPILEGYVRRE